MKHVVRNSVMVVIGAALVGCEWGGGGGGDGGSSWNSRYDFANFSGSYSGVGGYLVSEYTASSTTASSSAGELNVSGESKGTIPATSFAGQCSMTPVKPGSLHLFINGGVDGQFTDNGSGTLNGSFNVGGGSMISASGTINYDNGAYGIVLGPAGGPVVGKGVTITYTVLTSASGGTTTSSSTPGSSGIQILAFNVQQSGNTFKIIDNNGSVYEGRFGNISTTGGTSQDSATATFKNGDQVMAAFEASGTSGAGLQVQMTGNFQATIGSVATSGATTTMMLSDRRILGTWIESGGMTGNINGLAADIATSSNTSTNAP